MRKYLDAINTYLNENFDAFLIGTLNEFYLYSGDNRLAAITNFKGSNGLAIIGSDPVFFTDGRYTLEAKKVLSPEFTVIDFSNYNILNVIKKYHKIAFIPQLIKFSQYELYNSVSQNLFPIELSQFDQSLNNFQLRYNQKYNSTYCNFYSGICKTEKIESLLDCYKEKEWDKILICDSSCVSWLLNIRNSEIESENFDCIYPSFLLIDKNGNYDFIKNDNDLEYILQNNKSNIVIYDYNEISFSLKRLLDKYCNKPSNDKRLLDKQIIDKTYSNPIHKMKARKNNYELNGFINCHVRDAVAFIKFYKWLIENFEKNQITEIECQEKLLYFRREQQDFIAPSFETIAAVNENAAIIHYRPNKATDKILTKNSIFLIDSGGHYIDGTTDVTRTIFLNVDSEIIANSEVKSRYTEVLRGHIALASVKFPFGTKASAIDCLARQFLWQKNLDYKHATGHGVGFCLSVHEYPSISQASQDILEENFIVSIEPGFYNHNILEKDSYGIRIENLYYIAKDKDMLCFKPLTLIPIDLSLVDFVILSENEKNFIYNYHYYVFKKLSQYINQEERNFLQNIIKINQITT
jgi:Xaa-Pro aminopeptidase